MRALPYILLVIFALGSFAVELSEEQINAANELRERTLLEAEKQFPGMHAADMIDFYEQNASDMLLEWRRRCIYNPDTAQEYLNSLAKKYMAIEDMRRKSPEYYEYNVEQLRIEMEIRKLSYAIKALQLDETKKEQVQDLKAKLEFLLKTSFDKAQEMEQKNLRKLEAQLLELKEQVKNRAANRDDIIRQKFKLLTESN